MKHKLKETGTSLVLWVGSCIILTILIESIFRGSILGGINYFKAFPKVGVINLYVIILSTSLILMTKKRCFNFGLLAFIWFFLSSVNRILILHRGSPLTGIDFFMIKDGLSLVNKYLTTKKIFEIIFIFLVMMVILIIIWKLEKRKKRLNLKIVIIFNIILLLLTPAIFNYAFKNGMVEKQFADLFFSYQNNGFAYSFLNSIANLRVNKPSQYSKEEIDRINNNLNEAEELDVYLLPNIIFVQLESFMDPTWIKLNQYDTDPIPNFRNLSENYSSGVVKVPAFGGGTAKTEFEVITGFSTKLFSSGSGEIPYNTILRKKAIETINYSLKPLGYTAHAIHNHEGTFYDRYKVYPNLGFDTFTSIEFMYDYGKTPLGWSKDLILIDQIMKTMESTVNSDIIYTVSVQGHGGYPSEDILENKHVNLLSSSEESNKNSWEYYINQLYEMDLFIGELIEKIEERNEETIIIFFGDHLPALNIKNEDLITGNIYLTPYLIWDNIGLVKEEKELEAYQLSTEILNKINIKGGKINRFHSKFSSLEEYEEDFKLIQYDILYGKQYVYDKRENFEMTNMIMGNSKLKITDITKYNQDILIIGENFTTFSRVFINDKQYECEFISDSLLKVKISNLNEDDEVQIKQVGRNNVSLSCSKVYVVNKKL